MTLAVHIRFLDNRFDAARGDDRELPEWPPHPARLFCALVAGMRDQPDRDALRWLESQQPPVVRAGRAAAMTRQSFVVTNKVEKEGGNLTHVGRTSQLRRRAASSVDNTSVSFLWTQADATAEILATLDRLARRIPYLGRSTGLVLASATSDGLPIETSVDQRPVYTLSDIQDGDTLVRVPYPGYLNALEALHESGEPAWLAGRALPYAKERQPDLPVAEPAPSVYEELIAFRFDGAKPDGSLAPRFTEALRSLVLANVDSHAPASLHGHGADGRPHVAYLALPNIGDSHADGHLLGLAIAIPTMPKQERAAVFRSIWPANQDPAAKFSISVRGIGTFELERQPGYVRPWGAQPERWRRASSTWTSATPVVLDRFPKPGQLTDEIARSCLTVGLPRPVGVQTSPNPLTAGAVRLRPADLPEQCRGFLYRHVRLMFRQPVHGPVMLGRGRYLGLGLCAPEFAAAEEA